MTMTMTETFQKTYAKCLSGRPINVDKTNLTEEDASHLMGKAKEYNREAEYFEMHGTSGRAKLAYRRAERLEKLAGAIRNKLKNTTA